MSPSRQRFTFAKAAYALDWADAGVMDQMR